MLAEEGEMAASSRQDTLMPNISSFSPFTQILRPNPLMIHKSVTTESFHIHMKPHKGWKTVKFHNKYG